MDLNPVTKGLMLMRCVPGIEKVNYNYQEEQS
jgi:hypothetical protein